uniref:Uncharacterized protein n=1 Tax=Rhizobium leguminosarum TaxID=384 RepID=A0A154I7J5_RHILE|nr:hypothetical protein A4A59_05250 [Rhizobium leguminosarum]
MASDQSPDVIEGFEVRTEKRGGIANLNIGIGVKTVVGKVPQSVGDSMTEPNIYGRPFDPE